MVLLETMTLYQLAHINTDVNIVNLQAHIARSVSDNWKVLDSNTNWDQPSFLASLYIKQFKPSINDRVKVSKDLLSF